MIDPDFVTRRDGLKLLAAASAVALTACAPSAEGQAHPEVKTMAYPKQAPKQAPKQPAVQSTTRLGQSPSPWPVRDPFLFCVHHNDDYPAGNDQLGPVASLAGRRMGMDFDGKDGWNMYHGEVVPGFPAHPHRGFETVTVVRRGLIDHADSLGAAARYGHGDVQWLTAGAGIQHAEMFPLLESDKPNPAELFQIWLNLPAASKMVPAYFKMLWGPEIPREVVVDAAGRKATITRMAGAHGAHTPPAPPPDSWAARPDADLAIWTIALEAGATWTLPPAKAGTNRSLYFFDGKGLQVDGQVVPPRHRADLVPDVEAVLTASDGPIEVLLLQGRPIGEPVAQHGPFVMNTRQEIAQAFSDYQRTRFGGWPWDRSDPVHGREGRFARRPDGVVERPG
jgi:redox-sensitive bicupin YhaK (pirin superfamily)